MIPFPSRPAVCIALLLLVAATSSAQPNPQTREGFGISFGLGLGSGGLACRGCDFDREVGLATYVRIGGHLRRDVLLAGEFNAWTHTAGGFDQQVSFLGVVVQWYPREAIGLHLRGGPGFTASLAADPVNELMAGGMGMTFGVGYDWRVRRNFSLTPYVEYLHAFGAKAEVNGAVTGVDLGARVVQAGLGFTWH